MGLYEVGRADRGGHQEGPGRTVLGHALPGAKRRVAEDLPLEDASHSGVMGGLAQRRGKPIPPIDVYRVNGQHFVSDGHHRVSIALATGQEMIDAYVTEIFTTWAERASRPR